MFSVDINRILLMAYLLSTINLDLSFFGSSRRLSESDLIDNFIETNSYVLAPWLSAAGCNWDCSLLLFVHFPLRSEQNNAFLSFLREGQGSELLLERIKTHKNSRATVEPFHEINGNDIQRELNIHPGKAIHVYLSMIKYRRITAPRSSKSELLEWMNSVQDKVKV
jgi:hypothetical protein